MNLPLRKATAADHESLVRLTSECVAAMRASGIEQWDEVYPNAGNVIADTAAGTLDVLCENDAVIACITIDQNLDPLWAGLDWNPAGVPAASVHRLMVRPAFQGRGLATQLMQYAEQIALSMGCKSIRLDSFLQHPAAMALYPRLGYRRTGTAMMRKGPFAGFEKMLAAISGPPTHV